MRFKPSIVDSHIATDDMKIQCLRDFYSRSNFLVQIELRMMISVVKKDYISSHFCHQGTTTSNYKVVSWLLVNRFISDDSCHRCNGPLNGGSALLRAVLCISPSLLLFCRHRHRFLSIQKLIRVLVLLLLLLFFLQPLVFLP
jgi:hypothetical protein